MLGIWAKLNTFSGTELFIPRWVVALHLTTPHVFPEAGSVPGTVVGQYCNSRQAYGHLKVKRTKFPTAGKNVGLNSLNLL